MFSSVLSTLLLASSIVSARPLPHDSRHSSNSTMGAAYFITNDPSGNNVIVNSIDKFGRLSFVNAVGTGGNGLHGNSTGPDGLFTQDSVKVGKKMLFVVNPGSNTLTMFNIDSKNPTMIHMAGQPVSSGGEFPVSVAFSEKTNQVCVLNGGKVNGVSCYRANKSKGLTPIPNTIRSLGLNQTTPATGPAGTASDILFSPDGQSLLVSVKGTPPIPGFIAAYEVNKDGSLSAEPVKSSPAPGGALPFSMTLLPGTNALLATDPAAGFDIFDFSAGTTAAANSTIHKIDGQGATCWSSFSPRTGNLYLTDIITSKVTEVNVDKDLGAKVVTQYDLGAGSGTIDNFIASVGKKDFLYVLSANASTVDVMSLNAPGNATLLQKMDIRAAVAGKVAFTPDNLQGMAAFIIGK